MKQKTSGCMMGGVALSPTGQPLCHQQLIHRKHSSLVVGVVEPSFQKQSAMLVCVVAGAGSLTHFFKSRQTQCAAPPACLLPSFPPVTETMRSNH